MSWQQGETEPRAAGVAAEGGGREQEHAVERYHEVLFWEAGGISGSRTILLNHIASSPILSVGNASAWKIKVQKMISHQNQGFVMGTVM